MFNSQVSDFEPVLQLLESQNPAETETWATRYVLLLWLSIIVMIPFHMSRLDDIESSNENKKTVMERVLTVCQTYALVPDKCQDAAALLVSRFLTRSDVKEKYLTTFFDWACELSVQKESPDYVKYGTLASVAQILKNGKREDFLPHASRLLQWIINSEFKSNPGSNNQKLVFKIVQRIGLTFLPPRIAAWRYQRGSRSLSANLSAGDGTTDQIGPNTSRSLNNNVEEEEEANIEIADEVEEVIDQLIQGLMSTNSVARYTKNSTDFKTSAYFRLCPLFYRPHVSMSYGLYLILNLTS